MKIYHSSENYASLKSFILQLQLSLEFSQINEILSTYSEALLFLIEYSFLFETFFKETPSLKNTHTNFKSPFSSPDPARDGWNWWGYCAGNPVMNSDPNGLETASSDKKKEKSKGADNTPSEIPSPQTPEPSREINTNDGLSRYGNSSFLLSEESDKSLLNDVYKDLKTLKDIINNLNNTLQKNENVNESIIFAAERFLNLNLTDSEDYQQLKEDINIINSILQNVNKSNIRKGNHSLYKMYVDRKDSRHIINVTDLAKCDLNQDVSIFHEITHFEDSLGTVDNYLYTTRIPDIIKKQERLSTAQCWTLFYKSAFGRY